ncbi:MAG: helix-turn-helix domain-containing protein [Acidobacteria bacterium]|nr:helix-turn-helix domain-containing protein [Acidobacteriota bacterium]
MCDMLCGVCGFPAVPEGEVARGDNPLATLNLEQFVTAVLFISGRMIVHGTMMGGGLPSLSNRETHDLMLRTASIFEGWPDRFYDFLEYERSRPRCRTRAGIMDSQFGNFYGSLFAHARLSHASFDFFRLGFAGYLELCGEGHHVKRMKLSLKYITRYAALRRLGLDQKRLGRFISQGRLKMVTLKGWRGERVLVEAESVEKLREELRRLLGSSEAAKCLGVHRGVILKLVAAGCLKAVRGPSIDGSKGLKFDPRDVENLMRSITNRLPECDPLFKHCPDLRTAVNRFGHPKLGLVRNIKAIVAGKLLPIGSSPEAQSHSPS